MKIGETLSDGTIQSFSDSVLKIEICGPNEQQLSVIDIPGIFKRATAGVTTKEDIALVNEMVERYMDKQRSIILAVVPANVDITTQEILQMAEDCDPGGERTLGILTKPDLVDIGAEKTVIDILKGKNHSLKLGWHVVKNPGQKDLAEPLFDRHLSEQHFFETYEPWSELHKDNVGIDALRMRLVDVLGDMIHREFPKVCFN